MYSSAAQPTAMRQSSTGSMGSYGDSSSIGSSGGGAHPSSALSQQHFSSASYGDYSSPVHPSRSMHGGNSGSGAGSKYTQQQQQGGQSNSSMVPRAPGGSSYSSSGLSTNGNGSGPGGGGGRDLTPISHPGMHRSTQPQPNAQSSQQQRYSSSSGYQAPSSAYTGNVGPIGSLPTNASSSLLSDPWSDTSSPLGGGGGSYAQYPAMAGSAQSLMPLPPHPSAVPPAKGGTGAGAASKKSNSATAGAAFSTAPSGSGSGIGVAPFPSGVQSADPPEPDLPKPPRVDLAVRKQTLDALLGDATTSQTYWNLVEKYLLVKLSKSELDAFVIEKLGRRNLHVHNDFFLAVLQNAMADELPPKPARKKGEPRKTKVKSEAQGATAKGGVGLGKKTAGGTDATAIKKERKPRSGKKKDTAGGDAAGKKSKRKSRSGAVPDDELLTPVGAYLSSAHTAAAFAHKPMAHLLRPSSYFEALEKLRYSGGGGAGGPTAVEYGQGGSFDAGAADLSGAWSHASSAVANGLANGSSASVNGSQQTRPPVPVPVVPTSIPPLEGHLQPPRLVFSTANSASIEHALQTMQALFKPKPAAAQRHHPHTSQLALPRAKSVSPRSSSMQDDSAVAFVSSSSSSSSSVPSSLVASSSSSLSTVLHTPSRSPSSASPSRLSSASVVRDVLPLAFTSEYTAHWEQAAEKRKSIQTHSRSEAADPSRMDDDESSPSAAAADNVADDAQETDVEGEDDDLEESDPYARLGDPETRAYLSALHSQPVPDRDAVRRRLYTSALHSGVPNVSESAVTLLQQATEEHLKAIIASILEYARPDKRGSMLRAIEQHTIGAAAPEAEAAGAESNMEDVTAAAADVANTNPNTADTDAAPSVTPPSSANAAAVVPVPVPVSVPMDESAQRPSSSSDAGAADVAVVASAPVAVTQPAMQDASAAASTVAAASSASAVASAAPVAAAPPAIAAATTASSGAVQLSDSMTAAQRIAYVRDAMSGPYADPLLLPPLVHNTWASVNAHMPVDRSDSPLPPLRVDAPMRMPLSAAQLTAVLHQYPELLSNTTAPLILERLSACQ